MEMAEGAKVQVVGVLVRVPGSSISACAEPRDPGELGLRHCFRSVSCARSTGWRLSAGRWIEDNLDVELCRHGERMERWDFFMSWFVSGFQFICRVPLVCIAVYASVKEDGDRSCGNMTYLIVNYSYSPVHTIACGQSWTPIADFQHNCPQQTFVQ